MLITVFNWILISIAGYLFCFQVYPNVFGMRVAGWADNGDFARVMVPVGLEYKGYHNVFPFYDLTSAAFTRFFDFTSPKTFLLGNSIPSTAFAWIARLISRPFSEEFDIVILGRIYLAVLIAIFLVFSLCSKNSSRTIVISLFICILNDDSLPILNSFFSDPSAILALFTLVAVLFTTLSNKKKRVISFASGLILSLAKSQFAASLLILWLCGLLMKNISIKERLIGLIIALAPFFIFANLPLAREARSQSDEFIIDPYFAANCYVAIFKGVLLVPPEDAKRIMKELKIPEALSELIGTSYFSPFEHWKHLHDYDPKIWTSISKFSLLMIYATEPVTWISLAPHFFASLRDNQLYLPNFTLDELRRHPHERFYSPSLPFVPLLRTIALDHYIVSFSLLILNFVSQRLLKGTRGAALQYETVAIIYLIWFVLSQIVVITLFAGVEDLGRHLLVSRTALQLLIITIVITYIQIFLYAGAFFSDKLPILTKRLFGL